MLRRAFSLVGLFGVCCVANAQVSGSDIWLVPLSSSNDATTWVQVTDAPYYHNQPYFSADGTRLYFTGADASGQTDIMQYTIANAETVNLTQSTTSEYSPTPVPAGDGLSGIWVDEDGKQWLRQWDLQGKPQRNVISVEPIGYHVWLNNNAVLVFVLGQQEQPIHTLQKVQVGSDQGDIIDSNIGASLWQIPQSPTLFSYSARTEQSHTLKQFNAETSETTALMPLPTEIQYYAWRPDGKVVIPDNSRNTLVVRGLNDDEWSNWIPFQQHCPAGVSRLAFSVQSDYLALVCNQA